MDGRRARGIPLEHDSLRDGAADQHEPEEGGKGGQPVGAQSVFVETKSKSHTLGSRFDGGAEESIPREMTTCSKTPPIVFSAAVVSMADGSAMLLIHNPVIMEMICHIEV